MIKHLYICRHAKSDWSDSGQRDFDRSLNVRGHRDAPRIGEILNNLGTRADLLMSSTAERALLTAEYIAKALSYPLESIQQNEELYEASPRTILRIINELDEKYESVMIFGHNPTFTYVAEYFSNAEIGNLPTAGIVHVVFEDQAWSEVTKGSGKMLAFHFPKKYFPQDHE